MTGKAADPCQPPLTFLSPTPTISVPVHHLATCPLPSVPIPTPCLPPVACSPTSPSPCLLPTFYQLLQLCSSRPEKQRQLQVGAGGIEARAEGKVEDGRLQFPPHPPISPLHTPPGSKLPPRNNPFQPRAGSSSAPALTSSLGPKPELSHDLPWVGTQIQDEALFSPPHHADCRRGEPHLRFE